jgi:transposase
LRDRGAAGGVVIQVGGGLKVVLATQPVDFRRGVHGLAALVAQALSADPYCGDVFIFRSKRSDRLKLIAWDGSGMVLVTKWLEAGRFTWPPIKEGAVHLSAAQMALLIEGLDWTGAAPKAVKRPRKVG